MWRLGWLAVVAILAGCAADDPYDDAVPKAARGVVDRFVPTAVARTDVGNSWQI